MVIKETLVLTQDTKWRNMEMLEKAYLKPKDICKLTPLGEFIEIIIIKLTPQVRRHCRLHVALKGKISAIFSKGGCPYNRKKSCK